MLNTIELEGRKGRESTHAEDWHFCHSTQGNQMDRTLLARFIQSYRLVSFYLSSIIIITLITIIGAVSCFILCNEDEELKEAELILDTPTREAYEGMIQALKEGKDVSFPAIGQDEFTITIGECSSSSFTLSQEDIFGLYGSLKYCLRPWALDV